MRRARFVQTEAGARLRLSSCSCVVLFDFARPRGRAPRESPSSIQELLGVNGCQKLFPANGAHKFTSPPFPK